MPTQQNTYEEMRDRCDGDYMGRIVHVFRTGLEDCDE